LAIFSISKPFDFEEEYAVDGNYWELKDQDNLFGIHKRIYLLDHKGLTAMVYSDRAVCSSNDHSQAIPLTTKAIELDPKFAEPHVLRGLQYGLIERYAEALSDLTKAIELNPKSANGYGSRGLVHRSMHEYAEAVADYSKSIELNPIYASAYYGRGMANARIGNKEEARKDLQKAMELDPSKKEQVMAASKRYSLDLFPLPEN
jgi:tetratricopeptide (TPR) repeat protein